MTRSYQIGQARSQEIGAIRGTTKFGANMVVQLTKEKTDYARRLDAIAKSAAEKTIYFAKVYMPKGRPRWRNHCKSASSCVRKWIWRSGWLNHDCRTGPKRKWHYYDCTRTRHISTTPFCDNENQTRKNKQIQKSILEPLATYKKKREANLNGARFKGEWGIKELKIREINQHISIFRM